MKVAPAYRADPLPVGRLMDVLERIAVPGRPVADQVKLAAGCACALDTLLGGPLQPPESTGIRRLTERLDEILHEALLPALLQAGVALVDWADLAAEERQRLE